MPIKRAINKRHIEAAVENPIRPKIAGIDFGRALRPGLKSFIPTIVFCEQG